MESMASQGCQYPHLVTDLTCIPVFALSLTEFPCIMDLLNSVLMGTMNAGMQTGWQGTVMSLHTACISFAYIHAPLSY